MSASKPVAGRGNEQDAVDRFTAHPTVQKENAILRGEADTYDKIRLSSAQTAGLTVGQILRKPCGTLAVIVHVMTTHDSGNEHDYAWCTVKTADGGDESPTPEQVKDWSAQFVAHGIGDSELPIYEQLVDAWYAHAHVRIPPVRLTYVRWTAVQEPTKQSSDHRRRLSHGRSVPPRQE